ncbi:hypothetical protein EGJ55_26255 [Pseudomonas moraviensis]|nr:hypothetical protein EGJ55_26255 [Pseudomonas moraviensis]
MKVRASSRAGSLPQGERILTVGASLLAKGPSATPQNLDPQPRMLGSPRTRHSVKERCNAQIVRPADPARIHRRSRANHPAIRPATQIHRTGPRRR